MLEIIIINTLLLPEHSLLLILLIELCTNKYIVKAKKYRESEFIGPYFIVLKNGKGAYHTHSDKTILSQSKVLML